jgi:RNA polymerase sigma factor (sigma-70 family)
VTAVTAFKHPALKQLTDQQVRFAPPAKRREQQVRAEKLLTEIDASKQYPYQYICFRVTEYRPDSYPDLLIGGDDLLHDLRLMAVALAVPDDVFAEPVFTIDEVSKRWNVSTKTIRRWSKLGLVGYRVVNDGRQQLAFAQSVIDRFLNDHPDRIERGSRFSQMTETEREEILCQAKSLAGYGGASLTAVSRNIAQRIGRSAEAIRYTIRNFDKEHPEQAVFPEVTGPLDESAKESIFTSYKKGVAVELLAKRFSRTRTSVYRVINEVRGQRLLDLPLEYIPHPSFEDPAEAAAILAPMPNFEEYEAKRQAMKAPKDVGAELAPLYELPLLNKDQEAHLFRKMNFLKFRAAQLRDQFRKDGGEDVDPVKVRVQTLDEIEVLLADADAVKKLLINANMRLVVNIAKKHIHQAESLFELISDGNLSLMRAVEKFDFGRGFKFSTYASWAIIKNFARSIPDEKNRRERFVTGHDEVFDVAPDNRGDEHEALATQERATHSVNRLLEFLEPREREIIRMRAGLDDHAKGMTLEEIGQQFGITKERVRQLNARAMKKLREVAQEKNFEMP